MRQRANGGGADGGSDAVDDPGAAGAAVGPPQEHADGKVWYIFLAQTLSKVASQMQREILEGKLAGYYSEWCSTATPRVAGVAYRDYTVVYDEDGEPVTFLEDRAPENNIYIGLDANLLGFDMLRIIPLLAEVTTDAELGTALAKIDPVMMSNVSRWQEALRRTFWSCYDGLEYMQASEALAKR